MLKMFCTAVAAAATVMMIPKPNADFVIEKT
jgi:hypothetical protein